MCRCERNGLRIAPLHRVIIFVCRPGTAFACRLFGEDATAARERSSLLLLLLLLLLLTGFIFLLFFLFSLSSLKERERERERAGNYVERVPGNRDCGGIARPCSRKRQKWKERSELENSSLVYSVLLFRDWIEAQRERKKERKKERERERGWSSYGAGV